jgi:uncharacterized protein
MKFQPDTAEGVNLINRQEPARVWVGRHGVHAHSVLVPWVGVVQAWPVASLGDLTEATSSRSWHCSPSWSSWAAARACVLSRAALLRSLIERRIGVETMDTPAACRTYNVLVSEGRAVVAALLLEAAA